MFIFSILYFLNTAVMAKIKKPKPTEYPPLIEIANEQTLAEQILNFLSTITIKKALAIIILAIAGAIMAWSYHIITSDSCPPEAHSITTSER
jgi:hypothetical protein